MTSVALSTIEISVSVSQDTIMATVEQSSVSTFLSYGVTDHGALTGLSDDDHVQYHNDARGDARYYTKGAVDDLLDAIPETTPAGSDGEVQINSGGAFGSDADLYWSALSERFYSPSYGFKNSTSYFQASNDVRNWYLTGKTLSVSVETAPSGLYVLTDMTRAYMSGSGTDRIRAYDITTGQAVDQWVEAENVLVSGQDSNMQDIWVCEAHQKLYGIGSTNDRIYQYSLPNYPLLTGMTLDTFFAVAAISGGVPTGITGKPDGTKLFWCDSTNDAIYALDLSTPADLTTAVYNGDFLSVVGFETANSSLDVNNDGTRFYLTGSTGDDISEIRCATSWTIGTGVLFAESFTFTTETAPSSIFYHEDAQRAWVIGSALDTIIELATDKQIKHYGESFTTEGQFYCGGRFEVRGAAYFNQAVTLLTTLTVTSTATFAGNLTISGSGATFTLAGSAANIGSYTGGGTYRLGYGATLSGSTKTVDIGTNGVSGSTTNVNIGSAVAGAITTITLNGSAKPATMADSAAPNNSIYYSTDASKLVYKDGAGVVNNLY